MKPSFIRVEQSRDVTTFTVVGKEKSGVEQKHFCWGNLPLEEQSCYTSQGLSRAVGTSLG